MIDHAASSVEKPGVASRSPSLVMASSSTGHVEVARFMVSRPPAMIAVASVSAVTMSGPSTLTWVN